MSVYFDLKVRIYYKFTELSLLVLFVISLTMIKTDETICFWFDAINNTGDLE
ncbi:hypothetical protein EZS27_010235 [termite gut metagenome]|uniref:Uncharacterized protein n=1 Tax=termite gut metagenome TaxID=433724 RepID=A0A5J4S8G4_9ZZZZ